jgi:hypothetical protein
MDLCYCNSAISDRFVQNVTTWCVRTFVEKFYATFVGDDLWLYGKLTLLSICRFEHRLCPPTFTESYIYIYIVFFDR